LDCKINEVGKMKKLLIALLVVSGVASAETVATLPNQAGGKIVLTDEVCKDPATGEIYTALRRSYNYSSSGGTSEGCWTLEDETIVVVWINSNGSRDRSRYPLSNFTIKKTGNRKTL
jgi:hypothetical protein